MTAAGALRPKAAAQYLGVGLATFRGLGVPRTYLPGRGRKGVLVYRLADLDAFLEQHREEPKERAS